MISISLEEGILVISNTGPELSIPTQMAFTRFAKHNSNSESIGLGLSIVKKIMDLNHFKIQYSYDKGLHQVSIDFNILSE
jgi:signal transduction histidine kinase